MSSELYCCLCAIPLRNARADWLSFVRDGNDDAWPPEDGGWINPPGFPVPTKDMEDIVTISEEDGLFWRDWVCVGLTWAGGKNGLWVSPRCSRDGYLDVYINGSSEWQDHEEATYICIHRGCLSFLCRHTSITPEDLCKCLFSEHSPHANRGFNEDRGLLVNFTYGLMDERCDQGFDYAIEKRDPATQLSWYDPDTMDDMNWVLARPTVFPLLLPSPAPFNFSASTSMTSSNAPWAQLFAVPELLDAILEDAVGITAEQLADETHGGSSMMENPACLKSATSTLLALAQVNSFFAQAILQERQGLFLRIARLYGWMLPATPAEWVAWPNPRPLDLRLSTPFDWRAYVLTHLRGDDPHTKSRRRIYGMVTQFVKGTVDTHGRTWSVGEPGYRPGFAPPTPWSWELGDVEMDEADYVQQMDAVEDTDAAKEDSSVSEGEVGNGARSADNEEEASLIAQ